MGFYNAGSICSKDLFYLSVHGFCREISQYKPATDLFTYIDANQSQGGLQIFITDRNFKSHFSLDFRSQKGSPMIIPKYKRYAYVVDVEIDSSCNVSRASEMEKNNFNQCVDDAIQTHFGKPMGCVPPWMSLMSIVQCNRKYPNSYKEIIDDLWKLNVGPTLSLRKMEIEKKCRKYCSRGRYSVQLISKDTTAAVQETMASIIFNEEVKVY